MSVSDERAGPDGETREGRGRRRDPHQARRVRRGGAHRVPRARRSASWPTCAASLRAAGTEYKVFKNTLARRAAEGRGLDEIADLLEGPTAIAFVHGDAAAAAKALRDFGRTNAALVVKGGLLGERVLTAGRRRRRWPTLPSARGAPRPARRRFQAAADQGRRPVPGLPRNLAYGLKALSTSASAGGEAAPSPRPPPSDAPADDVPAEAADRPTHRADDAPADDGTCGRGRSRADAEAPRPRQPANAECHRVRVTRDREENSDHGNPHHRRAPRRLQEHDRPRAERVPQGVRGGVRRDRRGPGRGRRGPGCRWRRGRRRAAEEKDEFDVVLAAAGDKKIQVIKEVRALSPASA